jgi:ABC-type uncharacterized transport system YnjBCD ATPase subunit
MTQDDLTISDPKMTAHNVNVFYGEKQAINDVSIDVGTELVTAFIGPSGCGKSTFLRSLNRMNDTVAGAKVTGHIALDGEDIYAPSMDVVQLRARVGMVFQKPNPFPKSIYDNVAYGPRIHGLAPNKSDLDGIVEKALMRAGLWDEVKDRLGESGTALSGGQLHRARDRGRPRSDPDGRALLGARPDRDREDRRADPRTARQVRDRDRHPQYAAGGARVAAHRFLPPRDAGRIWQDHRHLHQPEAGTHQGLYHRPLRLSPGRTRTERWQL